MGGRVRTVARQGLSIVNWLAVVVEVHHRAGVGQLGDGLDVFRNAAYQVVAQNHVGVMNQIVYQRRLSGAFPDLILGKHDDGVHLVDPCCLERRDLGRVALDVVEMGLSMCEALC